MDASATSLSDDMKNVAEVPSIGSLLKQERIHQQKTLAAVAEYLKIRVAFLEAIENDKLDVLPGGIYTVGFIRSYASYLGLDHDAIVETLREENFFSPVSLAAVGDEQHFITNRFVPSSMVFIGIVLFIVCAVLVYFYMDDEDVKINWPIASLNSNTAPEPIL